ncbi:hypothetical protein MPLDJ20_260093 [Mesorhizobium plurifarium]|uniref:Uncharacterized protein n=1 Tax=Mesorhizobium plurifarium TaxID=69974 RepID=A0A090GMX5_MESPL|nr:hypothetical protein MPLDJ20_260093 [Mesorhizobium plurifarium]
MSLRSILSPPDRGDAIAGAETATISAPGAVAPALHFRRAVVVVEGATVRPVLPRPPP